MAWPDALPRRGLYLITPDTTDSLRLFSQCLRVLPARPALLQYRNKSTDPGVGAWRRRKPCARSPAPPASG